MCWLDIYRWGAVLAVTGRMRDVGQNVLQSASEAESGNSPVTAIFSSLLLLDVAFISNII